MLIVATLLLLHILHYTDKTNGLPGNATTEKPKNNIQVILYSTM